MKKNISWILTLAIIISLLAGVGITASATSFSDMPAEDDWSYGALTSAVGSGLLTGYEDGTIRPTSNITRAETAAIINRAFGSTEKDAISFSDVTTDNWYYADVQKAIHMKTFTGVGDDAFAGDTYITREQAFTVIARAIKLSDGTAEDYASFADASMVSSWAEGSMAAMVNAGYVSGDDGSLNPGAYITREEFAQVMQNVVSEYITAAGTYTSVSADGNVLIRTADVTLDGVTVKGDLIIGDGVGSGDVTLNNVTLDGRLVVRGGGENSIKLTGGGSYKTVVIAKVDGNIRIYADGVEVQYVSIPDGSNDIILDGAFSNVSVSADGINLVVSASSTISTIDITADNIVVDVSGTVSSITTGGVSTSITGSGTVTSVTAESSASGTTVATSDTTITNNSSGDVTVGDDTVAPDSTATTNSTGTSVTTDSNSSTGGGGLTVPPVIKYNRISGVSYSDGSVTVTMAYGSSTKTFPAYIAFQNGSNYFVLLTNGYILCQYDESGPFGDNDTIYLSYNGHSGSTTKASSIKETTVEGQYDTAYSQRNAILGNTNTVTFNCGSGVDLMAITYGVNSATDANFVAADGFTFLAPSSVTPSSSTAEAVLNNMLMQTFVFDSNALTSETVKELYTNDSSIFGIVDATMIQYIADNLVEPFVESVRDGTTAGDISGFIIYDETVLQYGDNRLTLGSNLSLSVSNDPATKAITVTIVPIAPPDK